MELVSVTKDVLDQKYVQYLRDLVLTATEPSRLGGASPYGYTFWYDPAANPRNVIERIIHDKFYDLIPADVKNVVIGAEYWFGRLTPPYDEYRKIGAHKDLGENPNSGQIESPPHTSVFYLTTVADGALIVFRDKPQLEPRSYEYVYPEENTFVQFSGSLWHSIVSREQIPPPGFVEQTAELRLSLIVSWWPYRILGNATGPMKLVAADYEGGIYPELAENSDVIGWHRGRDRAKPVGPAHRTERANG
jgi:hypothetical protein